MTQLILKNNLPAVSNFSSYVQYVMNIPNLSEKEELSLLEDFKKNNSLTSAQTLIMSQLKTVVRIAHTFKNYGISQEDLVQEGNIGLMKAVKNFNLNHQVRLYSYSIVWIKAEIQNYILKNWKLVKIGTTKNLKKLFFNFRKIQKEMIDQGIDKKEMHSYISKKLNVEKSDVQAIESYFLNDDFQISETINDTEDDFSVHAQLIEHETPEKITQKNMDGNYYQKKLFNALDSLNDKQKAVIKLRYYEDIKKTHKEISQIFGISSERVRQIEEEALLKLKKIVI